ncbi:hypothetical protein [Helicobacter sp. MIT 14-3879]|uniref:hypothetical protein n=1 Tax=Helicobacter sp. MIT 14-3879 TaxID=2040649 RepID=UPI000E1F8068|nr:hypothetical protein [Helicobacter sp. MIT 14-3879]RDU65648.1 hypothetical protein CQA44_01315 [Helicobacter sp. MIT 14-3879]
MKSFEILICLKSLDISLFQTMIRNVDRFIRPNKITIITKDEIISKFKKQYTNINFINEDSLYNGLSYKSVQNKLTSLGGCKNRTGWYLQQFLKMAYSLYLVSKNGGG